MQAYREGASLEASNRIGPTVLSRAADPVILVSLTRNFGTP
jgi:hypothetical protein